MGERVRKAFAEAGAHIEEVKVGITTPQRELSDVWSRLMMPLNLGALATMKHFGADLLKDHRGDFPPEYLRWIEIGQRLSLDDLGRATVDVEVCYRCPSLRAFHDEETGTTVQCTYHPHLVGRQFASLAHLRDHLHAFLAR